MSKIDLKVKLISTENNLEIETTGIATPNKIVYKENDISVTLILFDNKIDMKRVCNEYEINLKFNLDSKSMSTYKLFGCSKEFELETTTKKLKIEKNKIIIDYELEGNNFSYTLLIGG